MAKLNSSTSSSKFIEYIDGFCGSGKTHLMLEKLAASKNKESTLYIVETIKLGDEILHQARLKGINVKFFNSKNCKGIRKSIQQFVSEMDRLNKHFLLIITRASFELIDNCFLVHNTLRYNLIKDEVFDVINPVSVYDSFDLQLLKSLLTVVRKLNDECILLGINPLKRHEADVLLKDRDSDSIVRNILLSCQAKDMIIVSEESWNNLADTLDIIIFKTPKKYLGWKSQIFLGANFTSSFLYIIWKDFFNVDFKQSKNISKLRFKEHKLKCDLNIYYVLENSFWAKSLANQIDNETKLIEKIINRIQIVVNVRLGQRKVLSVFNRGNEKLCPLNWEIAPVKSQGLNCYQDYDTFVSTVSLNYQPDVIKLLIKIGLTLDIISEAMVKETLYQGMMRIKIRDPENTLPIHVFVMVKDHATFLQKLFKHSKILKLDAIKMIQ